MEDQKYNITFEAEIGSAVSERTAEAWAVGTRGGKPVSEDDPTYNNSSKDWALKSKEWAEGASGDSSAAEAAATAAKTAQGKAEAAQSAAVTAKNNAQTAQKNAETAKDKAEDAQGAAEDAAKKAEEEANKILTLTVSATGLAAGSAPTATLTVKDGHNHILFGLTKGDKGDPFTVKKTFASIAEMNAYTGKDIAEGDFVMITSNVEDEDNAKLFVKAASGYSFVTDLSGAQGMKGDKGDQGIQGIQGIQGEKGNTGDTGKITSRAVTYQASASGTAVPTGTWQGSIPTVASGEYLWIRTVNTWNNGGTTTDYSVSRMGIDGGGAGAPIPVEDIRTMVAEAFDTEE